MSVSSGAPERTTLVMGASGFLGSHVVRQLVARGDVVRAWTRPSSSTRAFDGLPVEHVTGELSDGAAVREAMRGVDAVHYCIVDVRAELRDPRPLFETNVEGLRLVLEAAVEAEVPRFVFCSTVGTIAIRDTHPATEDLPHNWEHLGGPYIRSRVEAERLVVSYARERGLPAVVLCVSTTYGPHDHGPTPHGALVRAAALGKLPVYIRGRGMEVVGIEDAAGAFLLAEERGLPGERYIISERMMSWRELFETAAAATGARAPRVGIPLPVMRALGLAGGWLGRLAGRDLPLTPVTVRLMHVMSKVDHGKAVRELGWSPRPAPDAVRDAAQFFAPQGATTVRT